MGQMQERITSTKKGSITSVQAIYVPADDYTDPAPATTFAHLDATTNLSRQIAELGIYPGRRSAGVDVAHSRSARHRRGALRGGALGQAGAAALQGPAGHHRDSRHRRAVEDDKLTVTRARKIQTFLSQPFFVGEQFTGLKGKYVSVGDTVRGFKEIVEGKHDALPRAGLLHGRHHRGGRSRRREARPPRTTPMALPTSLTLEIVTPDRALVAEQVDEVPGARRPKGYFGVLPRHAPLLVLAAGGRAVVPQGPGEALPGRSPSASSRCCPSKVTVLAADRRARRGHRRQARRAGQGAAEERIAGPRTDLDFERARIAMMKSLIRLQVASRRAREPARR
jgi:F0F1-type ATP synthase epsilon subunit